MGKWLLRFVKYFNPLFRRQGVETDLLYAIVEMKLLMDSRRVYLSWKQKQQQENKNQLNFTLFMYSIFGGLLGLTQVQMALLPAMIIFHAFVIFMMAMTLVTDFSSVLLDTADNQIILPRPVNSKTLFMARLIHILLYLLQFSIAICIIPVILSFIVHGPLVGLLLIITSQLTVLLAVSFTYILYLFVLTFSNEEKIKDIVSYFQIAMTFVFVLGYQVIPRLLSSVDMRFDYKQAWYSWFIPPVWMATAIEAVKDLNFDMLHIGMLVLAFTGPVILFWAMNKYLAPGFAKKLDSLSAAGGPKLKLLPAGEKVNRSSFSNLLAKVVCRFPAEKAAFTNTWKITARDKSFRLQFYPSFGYIPVFMFVVVFDGGRNMGDVLSGLPESNKFLILIYLPLFTISAGLSMLSFSESFQASWIYHSAPVARPGEIISGSIKAMIVKFFTPLYILFLVISLFVWGTDVINDFVMGLFNSLLSLMIIANLSEKSLPFSRQQNTKQQTGKFVNTIIQMCVVGLLIALHYFLLGKPLILFGVSVVAAISFWLLVKNLQSVKWSKISV